MLYVVSFATPLTDTQKEQVYDLLRLDERTEDIYDEENFFMVSSTLDRADDILELINPFDDNSGQNFDCFIAAVTADYAGYLNNEAMMFANRYREKRKPSKSPAKVEEKDNTPDKDVIDFSGGIKRDAKKIEELTLTPETTQVVARFLDGSKFRREAAAAGYKLKEGFQNILISGPAGVGKTTLAKALARAHLAEQKGSSERPILLIKPDDVIARYSGQTINNLKQAFERAKDGVVILDEIDSYEKIASFGIDVINGLNTHIGNNPNAPVIIGTLYESSVNGLFGKNTGLRSRFRHHIQIPGQDNNILSTILMNELLETGIKIHPDVKRKVPDVIEEYRKSAGNNFGHIREIENIRDFIVDSLARKFSTKKIKIGDVEITVNDLPTKSLKTGIWVSSADDSEPAQRKPATVVSLVPAPK